MQIFADDVTVLISAPALEILRKEAEVSAAYLRQILRELPLQLSEEKNRNLVLRPGLHPRGVFRRMAHQKYSRTKETGDATKSSGIHAQRTVGLRPTEGAA